MDAPEYLRELHERYQRFRALPWQRLTADQRRSLRYFVADTSELPAGPVVDRVEAWVAAAHALDAYIAENGQIPRRPRGMAGFSGETRRLAFWLEEQRRPSARARHCEYQILRIAAFPGLDMRNRDARWEGTYYLYAAHLRDHGVPAARSRDPLERSLSHWATRQRYEYRRGTLPAWRAEALSALPIWSFGPASGRDDAKRLPVP